MNCPMWHFPADYGLALTETMVACSGSEENMSALQNINR